MTKDELIEKYAVRLRIHNSLRPLANSSKGQENDIRVILTSFATEHEAILRGQFIADHDSVPLVDEVWGKLQAICRANDTNDRTEKLNTVFKSELTRALDECRGECEWTYDADEGMWKTGCGDEVHLESGDKIDGSFGYCPYCGRKIKEVKP